MQFLHKFGAIDTCSHLGAALRIKRLAMNKSFFTYFAIGLATVFASCNPESTGGKLKDSYWTLTSATLDKQAVKIPENSETAIIFSEKKITGQAPCNSYSASYSTDGGTIKLQEIGATKRFCDAMNLETAYFSLLSKAQTYSVRGDKLEINSSNGSLLFSRMKKGKVEAEEYALGIGKLAAQFPMLEGDEMLHLHPIIRVDNPGNYPFKGSLIDTSFYRYFSNDMREIWSSSGGDVFAVGQFGGFFICRIPGRYVSSDIAIFRVKDGEMRHVETIAWAWCDEGWCNQQDAWLTDADQDGRTDVIQHYTLTDDKGKLKEERCTLLQQRENGDMVQNKSTKLQEARYKMAKI